MPEDQSQVKFEICDDMIKAAKYGMKFIHETDKFKNYLLPCIVHAVFFIEAHQEYVKHWHELAKEAEKPIINFFKRGNHSECKKKRSVK